MGLIVNVFAEVENDRKISASEAVIPAYDKDGRISWELRARQVETVGEDLYLAKNPVLEILDRDRSTSLAKSDFGIFDLAERKAVGESRMTLSGRGFAAEGQGWRFKEQDSENNHHFVFEENTQIAFEHSFTELLAGLPIVSPTKQLPLGGSPNNNNLLDKSSFSSIAYAESFEVISLKGGGYQFVLEGNVSVNTENASITCKSAEILLGMRKHGHSEVSRINATGSVNLKQLGRECWADLLMWDANDSKVSLSGNARVVDSEWGEAIGEKILLEKGKGRAQVIGGKQGRSKLSLPNLPAFTFPAKKE